MGADPVACAALAGGADVKAFFVRKESKAHGLQRRIEGPLLEPGDRCLIVEDVVTSGGSTIQAIEAVREAGLEIVGVTAVLDRLAGGGERIEAAAGVPYRPAEHDRRRLPGPSRSRVGRRPYFCVSIHKFSDRNRYGRVSFPTGQGPRIVVKRRSPRPDVVVPPMERGFRGRPIQPWMLVALIVAAATLCAFDLYLLASLAV